MPLITIRNTNALLSGVDDSLAELVSDRCLAVKHPRHQHSRAYQNQEWDGMYRFTTAGNNREFPRGLVPRVADWLTENGHKVRLRHPKKTVIDTSGFTRDYLPPVGHFKKYWEHQYAGCLQMLQHPNGGIIEVGTGGGKTEMYIGVCRYLWEHHNWKSLILVSKKGLLDAMYRRMLQYYGGDILIGCYGDGNKKSGDITVGTAQTLKSYKVTYRTKKRRKCPVPANQDIRKLLQEVKVIILDEAHHATSETWYDITRFCTNAVRWYGFSGTPFRGDDYADRRLEAITGPVITSVSPTELIDKGLVSQPKIVMVAHANACGKLPEGMDTKRIKQAQEEDEDNALLLWSDLYAATYTNNTTFNRHSVIRGVEWLLDHNRQTLILCRQRAHFEILSEMLKEAGIPFASAWGSNDTSERRLAQASFASRKAKVLLATTIFDEGEDVSGIEAIVLAEAIKTLISTLQRTGRGMRTHGCRYSDLWLLDFVPMNHTKTIQHAHARAKAWESKDYLVEVIDKWPLPSEDSPDDLLPFESM